MLPFCVRDEACGRDLSGSTWHSSRSLASRKVYALGIGYTKWSKGRHKKIGDTSTSSRPKECVALRFTWRTAIDREKRVMPLCAVATLQNNSILRKTFANNILGYTSTPHADTGPGRGSACCALTRVAAVVARPYFPSLRFHEARRNRLQKKRG